MENNELLKEAEDRTLDAYEAFVCSNIRLGQLSSAKMILKDKVGNYGDVGMGHAYMVLSKKYKDELRNNKELTSQYYNFKKMLDNLYRVSGEREERNKRYEDLENERRREIHKWQDEVEKEALEEMHR